MKSTNLSLDYGQKILKAFGSLTCKQHTLICT